jgi:transposase
VRRYIARGLEPPTYGPRSHQQKSTDPFLPYLRERLAAFPGLTAVRLWRELRDRGYAGRLHRRETRRARHPARSHHALRGALRNPAGEQAQVDLARFEVAFTDEPGVTRIIWLFSMVLGFSRLIWARFVVHQDLQTILRCHIAALEAIGGAPREILYDRMKTAVIGMVSRGAKEASASACHARRRYGWDGLLIDTAYQKEGSGVFGPSFLT